MWMLIGAGVEGNTPGGEKLSGVTRSLSSWSRRSPE